MAVWLIRVLGDEPTTTGTSRFADVDASEWWSPYAEELADRDITTGCETGPLRYCPDDSVTRAQMASFLAPGLRARSRRSGRVRRHRGRHPRSQHRRPRRGGYHHRMRD